MRSKTKIASAVVLLWCGTVVWANQDRGSPEPAGGVLALMAVSIVVVLASARGLQKPAGRDGR